MNNDERVLKLKSAIEEKKKGLDILRFHPKTNCLLQLNGNTYNLHTLTDDQIVTLLVQVNAYRLSMRDLGIQDMMISQYSIHDWVSDLKVKRQELQQKSTRKELAELEKSLDKLLSEGKKTELELDNIEKLLS